MSGVRAISRKGLISGMQNVPEKIGYYFAGFADGEGSFNVSFRPREDYNGPWKVSLCFNVSQKDKVILALFKRYLQCGTLRVRDDGVWYYEVNNLDAIIKNVIPFFKKFHFLSAKKKRDFSKFCQIATLMEKGEHLGSTGIQKILHIRRDMNDGGKRKYSEAEILRAYQESSETACQSPPSGDKIQSVPSSDGRILPEMSGAPCDDLS